jgi:Uma2 family endonuclease
VRVQNSIGIPSLDSVPHPDLAWVRKGDYRRARPTSRDVLLVIEVADSSLRHDQSEKAGVYASAGIADYWIVNVEEQLIEVYRRPGKRGYRDRQTYTKAQSVSPLALPKAKLVVKSVFV